LINGSKYTLMNTVGLLCCYQHTITYPSFQCPFGPPFCHLTRVISTELTFRLTLVFIYTIENKHFLLASKCSLESRLFKCFSQTVVILRTVLWESKNGSSLWKHPFDRYFF